MKAEVNAEVQGVLKLHHAQLLNSRGVHSLKKQGQDLGLFEEPRPLTVARGLLGDALVDVLPHVLRLRNIDENEVRLLRCLKRDFRSEITFVDSGRMCIVVSHLFDRSDPDRTHPLDRIGIL